MDGQSGSASCSLPFLPGACLRRNIGSEFYDLALNEFHLKPIRLNPKLQDMFLCYEVSEAEEEVKEKQCITCPELVCRE